MKWWVNAMVTGEVEVRLIAKEPNTLAEVIRSLHQQSVVLKNVRTTANQCVFSIAIRDVEHVRKASKGRHLRIRFGRRSGLSFWIRQAWRRKSLWIGLALFGVLLQTLSSVVWRVSVFGVEGDTASQLVMAARESGLKPGAWRNSLPGPSQMQEKILTLMPNLLWVGVHIHGGVANIEAIEKVAGVQTNALPPQNIVATKTAVIRRVFATRGEVVVHPGQVVQPGQVIVSGLLANGAVPVAAQGQASAEVWYTSHVVLPLKVQRNELTGEHVSRDYLTLGSALLRVWGFEQPNYPHQVDDATDRDWTIGGWKLPIGWRIVRVYEVGSNAYAHSEQEADATALSLVLQDVKAQAGRGGTLLSQRILQREVSRGKLYETVLTQMEEDIGMPRVLSAQELNANQPKVEQTS